VWALLLVACLLAPAASAAPILVPNEDDGGSGTGTSTARITVNRLFDEVFTGQRGEVCTELMTPTSTLQAPLGEFRGPEGFNTFVATIWTSFPDAIFTLDDVSEAGGVVTVRWSMAGTHLGALDTVAPTGRAVRLQGLAMFGFEQDRIASAWIQYDRLGLIEQVTVPETPRATCPRCEETP
jgi:predicted ester cyclase